MRSPFKIGYTGALPIANGFRQPTAARLGFDEAFDRLKSAQGWIILKELNRDPEYAAIQRDCLAEIGRRPAPRSPLDSASIFAFTATSVGTSSV